MSDGIDCNCGAYSEHECGCGADWTTQEVYDLLEEVKQLREAADKVTRFEVIDYTAEAKGYNYKSIGMALSGRVLVKYGVSIELSYQDDGKTLKVFITDKES
jgi:hypothetical protein